MTLLKFYFTFFLFTLALFVFIRSPFSCSPFGVSVFSFLSLLFSISSSPGYLTTFFPTPVFPDSHTLLFVRLSSHLSQLKANSATFL